MTPKKPINYADYLSLESLLSAQHPESAKHSQPAHDEMLFIITHQTFELWFKQFLHELDSIIELFGQEHLQDEHLYTVVSRLRRMVRIQKLMIRQFDVLETMSPQDFLGFRDFLIPASGFQSVQYKVIEKKLGIALEDKYLKYSMSVLKPEDQQKLQSNGTSLFSGVMQWLERNPFLISGNYSFEKDYQKTINESIDREIDTVRNHPLMDKEKADAEIVRMESFKKSLHSIFDDNLYATEMKEGKKKFSRQAFLSGLFIRLYRHFAIMQMPYQILDLLIDINEQHVTWKRRHLSMIQRMIGMKMGTGGTSGKDFLNDTIRQSYIFSDLIEMPSYMVAKKFVPTLPNDVSQKLGYVFQ
jgi:tryptophan 2,3-dioxygenase